MSNLTIVHVPTGASVKFETFTLTEYQDNVSTKYSETPVFGRMDPITTYQGTTRNVSIGIRVQSKDFDPASYMDNMISQLASMQYPTYAKKENALTISRPPLIRVTFEQLLNNQLCAMDGFAFTPQTGFSAQDSPIVRYGSGITDVKRDEEGKVIGTETRNLIEFKSVTMKFNFKILHEKELAWSDTRLPGQTSAFQRWLGDRAFGPGKVF